MKDLTFQCIKHDGMVVYSYVGYTLYGYGDQPRFFHLAKIDFNNPSMHVR
jgi:hypothetical protein